MTTDSDTDTNDKDRFNPPKKNGVYLIYLEDCWDGYIAKGAEKQYVVVDSVQINGNHLSVTDGLETECDDFEIIEDSIDNTVLNLRYLSTDT